MFVDKVYKKYKVTAWDDGLEKEEEDREELIPQEIEKYRKYLNYGFEALKAGKELGDRLTETVKPYSKQEALNEKEKGFKSFMKKTQQHIEQTSLHTSNQKKLDLPLLKSQFDRGFAETYQYDEN